MSKHRRKQRAATPQELECPRCGNPINPRQIRCHYCKAVIAEEREYLESIRKGAGYIGQH